MTKVWKRTGAVAIYSRGRAALIALLAIVVIGGSGLAVGIAIGDSGDSSEPATPPQTVASPAPDAPAAESPPAGSPARSVSSAEGRKRLAAYRRGFRAGRERGLAGSFAGGQFEAGGAYFVRFGQRGRTIVGAATVRSGRTYWLCEGNTRLCTRGGTP